MKIGPHDSDRKVLVIAEIGNNHEGSYSAAEEMVGRAAEAGAHVVKFQTFRTELFVSPVQAERFERMKRFELSPEQFAKLAAQARAAGLGFVSSALDLDSVRVLDGIVDALKIASGDNTFYPLIEAMAATGKPIVLSTGLAELSQIDFAKSLIERSWRDAGIKQSLALLHCVTAYPVPPAHANLAAVRTLARRYDCTVGYSDHTLGTEACVLAVAAGARIIEKHFTLDNNYSDFRDHQLSADPTALKHMIEAIAAAEILLGSGEKVLQPEETASVVSIRRSIAAVRDLKAGHVLGPDDIAWLRPGDGIPPGEERRVLGRKLAADVSAGTILKTDHVR
jgi:N,N'-diacetyllegionaminate synthase